MFQDLSNNTIQAHECNHPDECSLMNSSNTGHDNMANYNHNTMVNTCNHDTVTTAVAMETHNSSSSRPWLQIALVMDRLFCVIYFLCLFTIFLFLLSKYLIDEN